MVIKIGPDKVVEGLNRGTKMRTKEGQNKMSDDGVNRTVSCSD